MELVDYLGVLRRRWILVVLAVLVCGGSAFAYSASQPKSYATVTRLVMSGLTGSGEGSATGDEVAQSRLAVERASTFMAFGNTLPAADAALSAAGYSPSGGRPTVSISADGVAPFLTIVATDHDPVRAAAVANAYAQSLPGVVARLSQLPAISSTVLTVLEPAYLPVTPLSPKPARDGAGGLALGLLLGVATAFLLEGLDRTYKNTDSLEQELDLAVLGVIPQELSSSSLPTRSHPMSGRAEAYRTVRINIEFAGSTPAPLRLVITSATQHEGKTVTAANLAVAFARAGQRVVLIDADLRRPQLASVFALAIPGPGLAGVLQTSGAVDEALWTVEPGLTLLPAGQPPENPSELLGSTRMTTLLDELGDRFDVIVIDSPPVLAVADALLLSINATGVVLVSRLDSTTKSQLRRATGALRQLDVALLGIVANGVRSTGRNDYHRYASDSPAADGAAAPASSKRRRA